MRGLLAKLANNKDLCQMSGIEMIFLSNNHTEYCPSMVDVLGGRPVVPETEQVHQQLVEL